MKARILAVGLGLILVLAAQICQGANRIVISSPYVQSGCGGNTFYISIENDEDISRLTLPLIARALGFGDEFWADSVKRLEPTGRLAGTLTGTRYFDDSRIDFVSPDPFVLYFEASSPGTDCLPAGPLQQMIALTFGATWAGSMSGFELDTMASPPCTEVQMLRCSDQGLLSIDQFVKGVTTFISGGEPIVDLESNSVYGMAGAMLHNQVTVHDPEGDPIGYKLLSGPGAVDANGLWTWGTRRQDTGDYTVVIDVFQTYCGPGSFIPFSFPVSVTPHPEGDVNCDGQADAIDLAELIDHLFGGIPLEPCPE